MFFIYSVASDVNVSTFARGLVCLEVSNVLFTGLESRRWFIYMLRALCIWPRELLLVHAIGYSQEEHVLIVIDNYNTVIVWLSNLILFYCLIDVWLFIIFYNLRAFGNFGRGFYCLWASFLLWRFAEFLLLWNFPSILERVSKIRNILQWSLIQGALRPPLEFGKPILCQVSFLTHQLMRLVQWLLQIRRHPIVPQLWHVIEDIVKVFFGQMLILHRFLPATVWAGQLLLLFIILLAHFELLEPKLYIMYWNRLITIILLGFRLIQHSTANIVAATFPFGAIESIRLAQIFGYSYLLSTVSDIIRQ